MADKEATVYIVDLGRSMGEKHHGRDVTDLEWSMRYVWDRIATMVATERKTLCAGVLGMRTDGTDNELDNEEAFENITVLQPIAQLLMPNIRTLEQRLKPSQTNNGDAISAIVIAIQMIANFCKKNRYTRRIILVTNGTGFMDADGIDDIIKKIQDDGIQIVVVGVDFDSPEFGTKEEDKSESKRNNEATLSSLCEQCEGVFGTLEEAISELSIPRIKSVKPVPTFRGHLKLGDPSQYETAMDIDVERFYRTFTAKAPSASSFVVRSDLGADASAQSSATLPNGGTDGYPGEDLSSVKNARNYHVKDENAPGGKKDVDRESLAKGYEYGRTAVHISESDLTVTKLETTAGLEIVGFVPRADYQQIIAMSTTSVIVGQRTNEKAILALSSLIWALYELETCAIARLVKKDGADPILLLLMPSIEPDFECLIDVELPFAEDIRIYKFPSLDRVLTVSGKILTEHRNIPNDELKNAMSDFVDSMDISEYGKTEEGEPMDYLPIRSEPDSRDAYSAVLHRLNQAIRARATQPDQPIPDIPKILTQFTAPPEDLLEKAKPQLEQLEKVADVKKVPPKTLSRKQFRGKQREAPRSGLDVDALLATERPSTSSQIHQIDPANAIPEFKQQLDRIDDLDAFSDLCSQFGAIVEDWINTSYGDNKYEQAVAALGLMKDACLGLEVPQTWNSYITNLKKKLLDGHLGGDRSEMWYKIRTAKPDEAKKGLGLLSKTDIELSEVGEETARAFLASG